MLTNRLTPDRYMFFLTKDSEERIEGNVDNWGDSFARDASVDEIREVGLLYRFTKGHFNSTKDI